MKIGITGSSGNLGSYLKNQFREYKLDYFNGRIENKSDVNKWIEGKSFDAIIHLAAIVPTSVVNKHKNKALDVNFYGTKNLIDSINKLHKKKIWFFYASTSHVYPFNKIAAKEVTKTKPISYYGKTKLLGEQYILKKTKKISPCIARIFSYTTKNQDKEFIIPSIINKLNTKNNIIKFSNMNHVRDFLAIEDICTAIKVLFKNKALGIFNICSNKKINLTNIANVINSKYKKELIFDNNESTILFGNNNKILKLGWLPRKIDYENYLLKVI